MSDLEAVRRLAGPTAAALEASRQRIDDLNVYPVPDGDTGTNLTLTVRAVKEALEELDEHDRERLAREIARAALMGARGNSGVILSQIVRGFAEVIGAGGDDRLADARAGVPLGERRRLPRGAHAGRGNDADRDPRAGRGGGGPGATPDLPVADLLRALVRRGEDALARTPQYLEILREAGVVDAGGAGLLELVRGLTAAVTGEALPAAAGRPRGRQRRRDPPGALPLPLLHRLRRRGRAARPPRRSRRSSSGSATR